MDEIEEGIEELKEVAIISRMMPEWKGSRIDGWNVKARFYRSPPRLSQICHPPRGQEVERETVREPPSMIPCPQHANSSVIMCCYILLDDDEKKGGEGAS